MTVLVLLQIYLVYKYFNIQSAVTMAFSGFWVMISVSAWNPYPMTLLTILILILLKKQLKLKRIDSKLFSLLALTASFGFHFSSAFAIFYPLIIATILFSNKLFPKLKQIIFAALAFGVPFIPQILFELKNGFPQFNAVINYIKVGGEGDGLSLDKIKLVVSTIFGENRNIIFQGIPDISSSPLSIIFLLFIIVGIYYLIRTKKKDEEFSRLLKISFIFFLIPLLGFFFLHFNLWYIYPLIPVTTILIGTLISKAPKSITILFTSLYVVMSLLRLNYYLVDEKPRFINDSGFYPVKRTVIDYIRADAGDRDFSVFTYKPDIYDFPYQYEFLAQGLRGETLPMEFAYEPGAPSYVKEKKDLLDAIDHKYGQRWRGKPQVIYYIVTENKQTDLLGNWWGRQKYDEIISQKAFGDRLVVYTATPLKD